MRKLLSLSALVAMFAISCQQEVTETSNIPFEPEGNNSGYVVPIEQALARLEAEMANIYGEDTRAANRAIKSVTTLSIDDVLPATRSGEEIDANELLYIVEFEDDKGSAILGADVRVDEVFAILDKGVITTEDFENVVSGTKSDELETYLAELIADEATEQVSLSSVIVPPSIPIQTSYFEYETFFEEKSDCILETKWGQGAPYNNLCYNDNNQLCVAGCVTICAAQVLLHNASTEDYITIGGDSFDVSLLWKKRNGVLILPSMVPAVNSEIAEYVKKLVDVLDITLGTNSSSGYTSNIATLMDDLGYTSASYVRHSDQSLEFDDEVRTQLYVRNLPTPIRGADVTTGSGHSWLMDGFLHKKEHKYWCTIQGNTVISREYIGDVETKKVHCNFGWNGQCDGYYTFGIFDVSEELDSSLILTEMGDVAGTNGNREYNNGLAIILYIL